VRLYLVGKNDKDFTIGGIPIGLPLLPCIPHLLYQSANLKSFKKLVRVDTERARDRRVG
jgi:hypothetical protein